MKNFIYTFALLLLSCNFLVGQIQHPNDFFPNKLGEHFMPHHSIVEYFKYAGEASEQATYFDYGFTNEKRPLGFIVISSETNMNNLEELRKDNLKLAGFEKGSRKNDKDMAVVWISCGVHGNEAGATNSAIATLYDLLDKNNETVQSWLDNTIVIIDPCLNPDGYSHYTHWNRSVSNKEPNPHIESKEHNEPWPGGRVNHYLFDLNRDWAWATQVETQQRLKVYNQWMPHVHVDVHEQGHNDEYYFAPAARPYHKYITEWQADFQVEVGENHTKYFDDKGWLYFTKEIFDLFYPSYGDTYPTFKGAIGMTYEQAGHSQAGRKILMENGDTLSLMDRILHHKTTALSTIEVSSKSANRLVTNFQKYYATSNKQGDYGSYVIKANKNSRQKINDLCQLLDMHKIAYGNAASGIGSMSGFSFEELKSKSFSLNKEDLVIPVDQPSATLIEVLFEPNPYLSDSLTYDITAWSLPYAYGLEAFAVKQNISIKNSYESLDRIKIDEDKKVYAYIIPWNSLSATSFLSDCLKKDLVIRSAWESFSLDDKTFESGSLIILKGDNYKNHDDFGKLVKELSEKHDTDIYATSTGFVGAGHDFGSSYVQVIKKPKLAVLSGNSISQNGYGHVWHFCEQSIDYPLTVLDIANLSEDLLQTYTTLILPNGGYGSLQENQITTIKEWVKKGGKLIAIQGAVNRLSTKVFFGLSRKKIAPKAAQNTEAAKLKKFGNQERSYLSRHLPGAIIRLDIDETHPLTFGVKDHYYSLKTNSNAYAYLDKGWNVGYTTKDLSTIGFVGHELKENFKESICIGAVDHGKGKIVYFMDNPVYRGFWKQGAFLLGNAIFMLN